MTDKQLFPCLDVLAVLYAPLEQYPPSVNQVDLMAQAGLRVGVIDCYHTSFAPKKFGGCHTVKRFRPTPHTLHYKEETPALLTRLHRLLAYKRCLQQTIKTFRPRVVIAYDTFGFFLTGKLWSLKYRPRLIWHFHEIPNFNQRYGPIIDAAHRFILNYAHEPDLVVFPDQDRSRHFMKLAQLSKPPIVVMNCTKLIDQLPPYTLSHFLTANQIRSNKIVHFHGWIGPSRGIEAIIHSMSLWPQNSLFILVGPITKKYQKTLQELADTMSVKKRLIFIPMVPISELFGLCVSAHLGCALITDSNSLNWKFSAGAINKRFEYMALGIPQIANTGPGMRDLIERNRCGVLVDPVSPAKIGEAIHSILVNDTLRLRLGKNARNTHLNEFNYEKQFSPVLNEIHSWLHNAGTTSDRGLSFPSQPN